MLGRKYVSPSLNHRQITMAALGLRPGVQPAIQDMEAYRTTLALGS